MAGTEIKKLNNQREEMVNSTLKRKKSKTTETKLKKLI